MIKTLAINALALGLFISSATAGVLGPIGGSQAAQSEANMSLVPAASSYYCTYVRYCYRIHYCYDSYDQKYQCGCYEWRKKCVKHYYKKNYSGGSGY